MERISKGTYVCEYRTYTVYPVGSSEEAQLARECEINGEGSYVLQTAYTVPQLGARLCFDATRCYKDVGRLINHSSVACNLKPGMPLFIRVKWRVGMVAVRDIFVGQELTYDYGVRSEVWMKSKRKQEVSTEAGESHSGGQQVMESTEESSSGGQGMRRAGESSCAADCREEGQGIGESSSAGQGIRETGKSADGCEDMRTEGVTDEIGEGSGSFAEHEDDGDVQILERAAARPTYKRSYFWCPEVDCTSGPVQKMTQHLQKKHKMTPALASQRAMRKRRAPLEAVRLKMPNPHTRSSSIQHLGLFVSKKAKVSRSVTAPTTTPPGTPMDTPATSTPASSDRSPPTPPCTPSKLDLSGKFHQGGPFLEGFYSHLRTRAGGNRGEHSATQITRYVGKYLYSLDAHAPVEGNLLKTSP